MRSRPGGIYKKLIVRNNRLLVARPSAGGHSRRSGAPDPGPVRPRLPRCRSGGPRAAVRPGRPLRAVPGGRRGACPDAAPRVLHATRRRSKGTIAGAPSAAAVGSRDGGHGLHQSRDRLWRVQTAGAGADRRLRRPRATRSRGIAGTCPACRSPSRSWCPRSAGAAQERQRGVPRAGRREEDAASKMGLASLLKSIWNDEYEDERDARFINDRVHANIQNDGTFSVVPAHLRRHHHTRTSFAASPTSRRSTTCR